MDSAEIQNMPSPGQFWKCFVEWDARNIDCYNVKAVLENAPKITVLFFFFFFKFMGHTIRPIKREKNCQPVSQEICTLKESLLKPVETHLVDTSG